MKNLTGLLMMFFAHGFCFHTASAQDGKTALVPLPSVDDFTNGNDGWGFGVGLGIEYESAYEGSDEFGFEVDRLVASNGAKVMTSSIGQVNLWAGVVFEPTPGYLRLLWASMKAVRKVIPMTGV